MTADHTSETTLIGQLCDADADRTLFITASGSAITAGQIREAAARLAPSLEGSADPLFVFTASAARMCSALLIAAQTGRKLILLPQAGASFCAEVAGLTPENSLGEFQSGSHQIELSSDIAADADLSGIRHAAPVLVIYTSGSSGNPKLIEKPISVLEAESRYWSKRFDSQFNWVCGSVSHQHIYGFLFRIGFPLLSGVIAADAAPLAWRALLESTRSRQPALIVSSPAHLTRIAAEEIDDVSGIGAILSSGGNLPTEAAHGAQALLGQLPIEIFGSTETGGVAWRQQTPEGNGIWTPLSGVQARCSESGTLQIVSDYIPDQAMIEMGDQVEIEPDGRFRHKGRADQIAKIEGKRVSLSRVSSKLTESPLVKEAAVIVTETQGRERLSAVLVPSDAGRAQLVSLGAFRFSRHLVKALSGMLEPAELPKRWRFLSDIPRNAQSKLSARMLADLFEGPRMLDILNAEIDQKENMEADLRFDADPAFPWFEGHFRDHPVLPGLSQVHMAVTAAEELWAVRPGTHSINRLKFNRVIQPNESILMKLKFNDTKKQLSFSFSTNGTAVASGTIG